MMCSYVMGVSESQRKDSNPPPHDISNPSPAGVDPCVADRWALTGLIDFCEKGM